MDVRTASKTHRSGTAKQFALAQLKDLKKEFLVYASSVALFAGLALAPAQFLHFFSVELNSLNGATIAAFLVKLLLLGLGIASCLAIATFGRNYFRESLLLKLESHLRLTVVDRIHKTPLELLDSSERGEWLTKITSDIRATEDFLGIHVPNALYDLAIVLGATFCLSRYSLLMASGVLGSALLLGLINSAIQRDVAPRLEEQRTLYSSLLQILLENIEGWKTIRSFRVQSFQLGRANEQLLRYRHAGLSTATAIGKSLAAGEWVTQVLVTGCLMVLAYQVALGGITPNDALVYPFYLAQFFFSARSLMLFGSDWSRFQVSGARLATLFSASSIPTSLEHVAPARNDHELQLRDFQSAFETPLTSGQAKTLSLTLRQGEMKALMGPSGCGKSTLLEVLAGLRCLGTSQIQIRAKSNVLWTSSTTDTRSPVEYLAYVEQRPYLMEASLRNNLTLGQFTLLDDELHRVLSLVGLRELTQRGGLDLAISGQGNNLSEGQIYRIGIARALLLGRPFLLLDEPFAALDKQSTQLIVQTLNHLKASTGILLVTHDVPEALAVDTVHQYASLVVPVSSNSSHGAKLKETTRSSGHLVAVSHSPH